MFARVVQLRSQLRHRDFVILVLLLTRGQLRLKIAYLFLYIRELLLLLRFVGADFAYRLLGVGELLFQVGIFGDENLDSLLCVLQTFQVRKRVIAFFVRGGDLLVSVARPRISFVTLFAGGSALFVSGRDLRICVVAFFFGRCPAFLRCHEHFLQLRDLGFERLLRFAVCRTSFGGFLQRCLRLS